jgi:hypothetical protein
MQEGTTSSVMAVDKPFGEFYDFLHRQYGIFWTAIRISMILSCAPLTNNAFAY